MFSLRSGSVPQGQICTCSKYVLVLLQCGSVSLPRAQLLLAKDKDNEIQPAKNRRCGACEIHAQVSAVAYQHICRRYPMKKTRKSWCERCDIGSSQRRWENTLKATNGDFTMVTV